MKSDEESDEESDEDKSFRLLRPSNGVPLTVNSAEIERSTFGPNVPEEFGVLNRKDTGNAPAIPTSRKEIKMLVARLFLISPLWVAYFFHETYHGPLHEEMSFSTLLIISVVAYVFLCWWDSGRAPRSAVSVIIRNMALAYCVVWSFLLLFGAGWFFWYMISHATVWVILFWQFVVHTFAHHFIYPFADPNYYAVRRAGWHPFWDVTPFNFDSELIKDGGFEEPEYTGFVPPEHWRFQCPVCGARQQTNFGVCWNCNYGADGDATAYYERWGR